MNRKFSPYPSSGQDKRELNGKVDSEGSMNHDQLCDQRVLDLSGPDSSGTDVL